VIRNWQDARPLAVLVLLCSGCSDGAGPPATVPTAPVQAPVAVAAPEVSSVDSDTTPPIATPSPDVARFTEAREAFHTLTSPGIELAAWESAQQKLIALGKVAEPVLLEGLRSTNPMDREMAATVCALSGSPSAELQAALITCLADEAPFARASAAAALASVPEHQAQAIGTLTDLLAHSDPQLRRMAAANLSSFGDEASGQLPKLTAVLADDDAEVVMPVIQLLGRMGPTAVDAVPELQRIAFEESGDVKQAAEQALLQIQATDKPAE